MNLQKFTLYITKKTSGRLFFCLLLALSYSFSGCEKKSPPPEIVKVVPASAIKNLQVINPSFFVDLNTAKQVFIAGSDGTIVSTNASEKEPSTTPTQQWDALNTYTSNSVLGIASNQDQSILVAVGEGGLILVSIDAGKTWKNKSLTAAKKISAIAFDSLHKTWIAAGEEGLLIQSTDNADNWIAVETQQRASIRAIYYLESTKTLTAIGENGLLLFSQDGGIEWKKIALPTSASLIDLISVDSSVTLIACADGNFLRSEKSLEQWELIESGSSAYLTKLIHNPAYNTLIALSADGEILLSDDGGTLWAPVASPQTYLTNATLVDEGKLMLIVGNNGTILRSDNGGRTWDKPVQVTLGNIEGITAILNKRIVAYGEGGLLLQSDDAGNTWQLIKAPITDFIHQLLNTADNNWLAVGAKGLLLSSKNSGQDWQPIDSLQQKSDYLLSIILDKKSGALITAGPPGTILVSNDQGNSWHVRLSLGDSNQGYFHQLIGDNNSTLVALAGPGTIHYSTNAGKTWDPSHSDNSKHLFAGTYDAVNQQFVAVGQQGIIQLSSDGENWVVIDAGISQSLQTVYADAGTLWAAGEQGILLSSADAGKNWKKIPTNINSTILSVERLTSGTLIATGSNGLILRSTDDQHWSVITSPVNEMLRKPVQDSNTGIIYIPSRGGNIVYSKDDGKQWSIIQQVTQASIKALAIDTDHNMLLANGERLLRIPLLNK